MLTRVRPSEMAIMWPSTRSLCPGYAPLLPTALPSSVVAWGSLICGYTALIDSRPLSRVPGSYAQPSTHRAAFRSAIARDRPTQSRSSWKQLPGCKAQLKVRRASD